mmetsp:Transcript_31056/g.80576  ORF Transcript_31056/g.80576 Transcript_31056/m.80576 type:complete len:524 (-) Transcript_31056:16-1587(-)
MLRPLLRKLAVAAVAAYLAWLAKNWRRIKAVLALPGGTVDWTGDVRTVLQSAPVIQIPDGPKTLNVYSFWQKQAKKYRQEGLFVVRFGHPAVPGTHSVLVISDLAAVKEMLHRRSFGMYAKGESYDVANPLVGSGILVADDGPGWETMRTLANAGFRVANLEESIPMIAEVTARMVERWKSDIRTGQKELDIFGWTLRLTMDILGRFAFSHDFQSVMARKPSDAPLYVAFQTILTILSNRQILRMLPKITWKIPAPWNARFNREMAKLDKVVDELISARRRAMATSTTPVANDVLESLLQKDEHGEHIMSDQLVSDNMKTLLFAGHDTTASALTWALHLLAKHQDWQEKLRGELKEVGFAPNTGAKVPASVTYTTLSEMKLLSAVVRETLRIYPSAGFTREVVEPTTITVKGKDYELYPGMEILILPPFQQTDPENVERPEEFDPGRWLDKGTAPVEAVLPFSLGSRNCVGERLAMTELRVALALLVTNFQFDLVPGVPEPFQVLLLSLEPFGVKLAVTPLDS